jgi:hypothetical protein
MAHRITSYPGDAAGAKLRTSLHLYHKYRAGSHRFAGAASDFPRRAGIPFLTGKLVKLR